MKEINSLTHMRAAGDGDEDEATVAWPAVNNAAAELLRLH